MTFVTHNSPLMLKTNSVHSKEKAGKELSEFFFFFFFHFGQGSVE